MVKAWAILTIAVGIVTFAAAPIEARGMDGVTEILKDVLGLDRTVRGHVVQIREATLVLRSADAQTYTINAAGLDTDGMRRLRDGQPVSVTLKRPGPEGMPIASAVATEAGPRKVFQRVEGVVEAVTDERITFRARDGRALVLDRARIVGEPPRVTAQETGTLIYEQEPSMAGVWIETREVLPAAAPRGAR